jgi:hypothetical protein
MNAAATSVVGRGGAVVAATGASVVGAAVVVTTVVVEAPGGVVVFESSGVADVSAIDVVVGVRVSDDVDVSVEHDTIATPARRTTSRRIARRMKTSVRSAVEARSQSSVSDRVVQR